MVLQSRYKDDWKCCRILQCCKHHPETMKCNNAADVSLSHKPIPVCLESGLTINWKLNLCSWLPLGHISWRFACSIYSKWCQYFLTSFETMPLSNQRTKLESTKQTFLCQKLEQPIKTLTKASTFIQWFIKILTIQKASLVLCIMILA